MRYTTAWLLGLLGLPTAAAAASEPYQLGVGDVIQVDVFQEADLSDSYLIGDDGTIEMPLLGVVQASGMSVEALDEQITIALGERFIVNPQVTVQVEQFKSQSVQVLGEVNEPGVYYLTGATTLEELLAMAGGIKADRSTREALIKNERDDSIPQRVVNLETLRVSAEDAVYLRGGDVVYILQGQIVSVNGQVKSPGDIPFREGMTVLDALSAAGGLLPTANIRRVTLKRDEEYISINVRRVNRQKEEDLPLLSGDKLIIEESIF